MADTQSRPGVSLVVDRQSLSEVHRRNAALACTSSVTGSALVGFYNGMRDFGFQRSPSLNSPPSPLVHEFRKYYGPTMSAFEAAEKNGRAADLQKEFEDSFDRHNKSASQDSASIHATFPRVTLAR